MRAIDADAFTEIIHGMYAEGDNPSTYHVDAEGDTLIGKFAVVDAIFNMPTIHPEPHWIPVEQDTPTEDDDYWCTFGAETGWFVDWCSWYQGRWVVWTDDTVSEVSNVIAWCKPMEPYKEVTNGN